MGQAYRADNVGSLLCPLELLQVRAAPEHGHSTLAQLRSRNACLDICSLVVK
jgi:hypothetical protein